MTLLLKTETFNIITSSELKDLARENYGIIDYDWFNLNSDSLPEQEVIGLIPGLVRGKGDERGESDLRDNYLHRYSGDLLMNMLARDKFISKGKYIIKND